MKTGWHLLPSPCGRQFALEGALGSELVVAVTSVA